MVSRNWEEGDLPPCYRQQALDQGRYTTEPVVEVTLPIDLVSANRLLRMHWREQRKLRQDYRNLVYASGASRRVAPEGRQRVSVTRILGPKQQLMDADNVTTACKSLVDALRDQRLIRDDTPAAIELHVDQDDGQRANGPAVRVRVEPEGDHAP